MVLFASVVFLANIPGACLAESGDNTGINKRDRSEKELTADQQGETKEDREITQKIRRAIMDDKSLSTYAHNVKIITVGGMVTLKGPVRSEEEKKAIEEKAAQIAGNGKITSEMDIVP
jgi:osmotically-inducible protein OsmY